MTVAGLEHFTTDELIAELINRTTFGGLVIWFTSPIKDGRSTGNEIKFTKSPLDRGTTEYLLKQALDRLPGMFGE